MERTSAAISGSGRSSSFLKAHTGLANIVSFSCCPVRLFKSFPFILVAVNAHKIHGHVILL